DPRRRDTDGDGLGDGMERGLVAGVPSGTSGASGVAFDGTRGARTLATAISGGGPFRGDADPMTLTSPRDADSDDDGIADGEEDRDRDGRVDPAGAAGQTHAETDPARADTDADGLADGLEGGLVAP